VQSFNFRSAVLHSRSSPREVNFSDMLEDLTCWRQFRSTSKQHESSKRISVHSPNIIIYTKQEKKTAIPVTDILRIRSMEPTMKHDSCSFSTGRSCTMLWRRAAAMLHSWHTQSQLRTAQTLTTQPSAYSASRVKPETRKLQILTSWTRPWVGWARFNVPLNIV